MGHPTPPMTRIGCPGIQRGGGGGGSGVLGPGLADLWLFLRFLCLPADSARHLDLPCKRSYLEAPSAVGRTIISVLPMHPADAEALSLLAGDPTRGLHVLRSGGPRSRGCPGWAACPPAPLGCNMWTSVSPTRATAFRPWRLCSTVLPHALHRHRDDAPAAHHLQPRAPSRRATPRLASTVALPVSRSEERGPSASFPRDRGLPGTPCASELRPRHTERGQRVPLLAELLLVPGSLLTSTIQAWGPWRAGLTDDSQVPSAAPGPC